MQSAAECERTVGLHPHCGECGAWEGRVLNITGHAVLFLQVRGEAEDALLGERAVRVSCAAHAHSEGGIWGNQPADLSWGPAPGGRAWHRLEVSAVYGLGLHEDLHIRPSCGRIEA